MSIVIVTYNYAQYISDAIQSALSQTYKNCEILVVDDGSSDNTEEVVAAFKKRVTYYRKRNGGVSSARNYGLTKAHGNYIVFLDSDDQLAKEYVAETVSLLRKQDVDVGFIYTQQQSYGDKTEISTFPPYNLRRLLHGNYINVCSLFRRSIFEVCQWDEGLRSWEDWNFYLSLAEHGVTGVLLDKPLLLCRIHHSNPSTSDKLNWECMIDLYNYTANHHIKLYGRRRVFINNMWYRIHKFWPHIRYRKPA